MDEKPLRVIAGAPDKPLIIGDLEIACYVLEGETRVISRASVLRAIGRASKAKGGRKYDEEFKLPVFLTAKNLKPFISNDLGRNSKPILFEYKGKQLIGHKADLLPQICEVFLDADQAGILRQNQAHIADACRTLHRAFARIGIIGLVDEATGYQRIRAERALAVILEKYIAKELQPWTKTFPYEFYEQIFRLKGWPGPDGIKRPAVIGHYTNDIVYSRLDDGILKGLQSVNPRLPRGGRKDKHHQWFTRDIGYPELRDHLTGVMALMRAAPNWDVFRRGLQRAYPKLNETIPMPLDD